MTLIERPAAGPDQGPGVSTGLLGRVPTTSTWVIGPLAALQAAAVSLLTVLLPVLLLWAVAERVGSGWSDAARVGTDIWLVGHGVRLALAAGEFSLTPLAMLAGLVWWTRCCADRVLLLCDERRGSARGFAVRAAVPFVLTYTAVTGAAALAAGTDPARPLLGSALVWGATVSGLAMLVASHPWWRGEGPRWARWAAVVRAARWALTWWFGLSLALVLVSLVANWGRVVSVQQALQPGVLGHLGLILLQLLLLPTAAVWAGAWSAGPGFTIGTGTSVTPFGTELAPGPALPLLGALPQGGPEATFVWWAPLLVVLAGFVVGARLSRGDTDQVDSRWWVAAFQIGGLTALLAAPLLWVSAGSIGPGRFDEVGPRVFTGTLAIGIEIAIGAALGLGLVPGLVDGRAAGWWRRVLTRAERSGNKPALLAGAVANGTAAAALRCTRWVRSTSRTGRDRARLIRASVQDRAIEVLHRRR